MALHISTIFLLFSCQNVTFFYISLNMYYIVSKTSLIMSPIKVEVSLLDNAPITILAPYWKRMAMKCPKLQQYFVRWRPISRPNMFVTIILVNFVYLLSLHIKSQQMNYNLFPTLDFNNYIARWMKICSYYYDTQYCTVTHAAGCTLMTKHLGGLQQVHLGTIRAP